MSEAFRLGGWGMYPTTIVGLVLLVAAIQYARQPDLRRRAIVGNLLGLTFIVGCLGFVTGVIKSFTSAGDAPRDELGTIVVVGVGESLVNIGLGLVLVILASIVTTIGSARASKGGAELADPHGH